MPEENPSHWKDRLQEIYDRSAGSADIAYYVQMRTLSENNERRILALVSAACAAIALVLQEDDSSVVRTIMLSMGTTAFGLALYHEFGRWLTTKNVQVLCSRNTPFVRNILDEIHEKIPELSPIVDEMKSELPDDGQFQ